MTHTKLDSWVVLANLVTIVVRKEHVRRQSTLWRVGVYEVLKLDWLEGNGLHTLTLLALAFDLGLRLSGFDFLRHFD
jgi:hypothetical protein